MSSFTSLQLYIEQVENGAWVIGTGKDRAGERYTGEVPRGAFPSYREAEQFALSFIRDSMRATRKDWEKKAKEAAK